MSKSKYFAVVVAASVMTMAWIQEANASQSLKLKVSFTSVNSGFQAHLPRVAEVQPSTSIEIQQWSNNDWSSVCVLSKTQPNCAIASFSGIDARVRFRTTIHTQKHRWIEKYLISKTPTQTGLVSAVVQFEQTFLVNAFGSSASGLSEGYSGMIGGVNVYWSVTNPSWAKASLAADDPGTDVFHFVRGKWKHQGRLKQWPQDTGKYFQLPKSIQDGNWLEIDVSRQLLGYR